MSKHSISIIAYPHPFYATYRIMRSQQPGETLAEISSKMIPHRLGLRTFFVDGEQIKDLSFIPAPGSHVLIKVTPAGSQEETARGFDKVGVWGVLVGIGLIVAGFFTGGATWGVAFAFFAGGVASGAIGALINITASMGDVGAGQASNMLPGIRGGRNRLNPLGKVPLVLGKHLITPFYAAKPYTSIGGTKGKEMYLHQLFAIGYGPGRVSQIKIGETLLASNSSYQRNGAIVVDGSFAGVTLDVYENGTASTIYPEFVLEDSPQMELRTIDASGNPVDPDTLWRTTAKNVDKVSIDITLPRGLYKYNDSGDRLAHSVTVTVKRRVTGSGTAWVDADTVTAWALTESDVETQRYTYTDNVAAGQYDYAVWRSADDASDLRGTSLVQWTALRSIRSTVAPIASDVRSRYVVMALKIKASAELQGIIDQVNCIYEPEVNVYNGTNWADTGFTSNPAAAYLYLLKGPANPRPVPEAAIDYTRLINWWATCATKGWTCDYVISRGMRLRDALNVIAGTGRGNITMRDGGLYSVVVDEAKADLVQIFTARNVRNFKWTKAFKNRPHGLKVNFISAEDGYAANERIALDDGYKYDTDGDGVLRDWNGVDRTADSGYLLATQFEQLDLPGVTSAELALKHGRYALAVAKLRPEIFSFETDAEAIVCEPGDLVRVAHDSIVVGIRPGRVKALTLDIGGDTAAVTIDETILCETGKTYGVRFRLTDGTSVYATLANPAEYEGSVLTFTESIPAAQSPAVGDLYVFGESGIETVECIVTGIESLDELACRVYVADAADGVHSADSGTIPEFKSFISLPSENLVVPTTEKIVTDAADSILYDEIVSKPLPTKFLGRYYATHPAAYNSGDAWMVYCETDLPIQRGVYYSNAGTPERITTSSDMGLQMHLLSALSHVAWAEEQAVYGTSADYGIDSLFQSLAAVSAFFLSLTAKQGYIESLLGKLLELQTGGAIYSGYSSDGNTPPPSESGFWLGASGVLKAKGGEFSGAVVAESGTFSGGVKTGVLDIALGADVVNWVAPSPTWTGSELLSHLSSLIPNTLYGANGTFNLDAVEAVKTYPGYWVIVYTRTTAGISNYYVINNSGTYSYQGNIDLLATGSIVLSESIQVGRDYVYSLGAEGKRFLRAYIGTIYAGSAVFTGSCSFASTVTGLEFNTASGYPTSTAWTNVLTLETGAIYDFTVLGGYDICFSACWSGKIYVLSTSQYGFADTVCIIDTKSPPASTVATFLQITTARVLQVRRDTSSQVVRCTVRRLVKL